MTNASVRTSTMSDSPPPLSDEAVAATLAFGHWLAAASGPWTSARTITAAEDELRASMGRPGEAELLSTALGITLWHFVELLPADDPWRHLELADDGSVIHPTTRQRFRGGAEQQRDVDPHCIVTSDDLDATLDGLAAALVDCGPEGPAVGLLIRAASNGWGGPAGMLAGSSPDLAVDAGTTAIRLVAWRLDALGIAAPAVVVDLGWWAMHYATSIVRHEPVTSDDMAAIRWPVMMRHRWGS